MICGYGCKRVTVHLVAASRSCRRSGIRVQRARSWIRNSPSTHNSTASTFMRNPPQYGGRGTSTCDMLRLLGAGPVVRNTEAVRRCGHGRAENGPRLDGLALPARPGAEAALPGAGAEIGVVLGIGERLHAPLGTHLAVAVIPMKNHRGSRIDVQLTSFARLVIRVEDNEARVRGDFLAKHHARRGLTAVVHRGEYHGIGIRLRGVDPSLCQPLCRDLERIVRQGFGQCFGPMRLFARVHVRMVTVPGALAVALSGQ